MVSWIQGKDLITVNVGGTPVGATDTVIQLQAGHGAWLPTANFYLFFPGNTAVGELPEYVYIQSKSTDALTVGTPPYGNTSGNGRTALANVPPNNYAATTHPTGAVIQLRSTWEVFLQLQAQIDAHIHDGSTGNGPVLGTGAITNLAITTAKIADGNVTTIKIADANVTLAKMAANSVDTSQIVNNAVLSAKIADGNVTTTKIGDGNVTTIKIADGNITTAKIGAGQVTGSVLGSDVVVLTGAQTITGVKTFSSIIATSLTMGIGGDATNDTYYRTSGGALGRIAAPSNAEYVLGHVSGVPTWGYRKAPDPGKPQPINNILVNGGFEIFQRFLFPSPGVSSVTNLAGVSQYCADRWLTTYQGTRFATVCGYTPSPGPSGGNGSRSLWFTVAGSGLTSQFAYIIQKIEHASTYAGLTLTFAIDAYSDAGQDLRIDLYNETAGGPMASASHSNNGTWQRLSCTATVPTSCTNITVRIYGFANGTYYIDNAMLTCGNTAPWTPNTPAQDLAECQRYYEIVGEGNTGSLIICGYGIQTFYETVSFATTKMASGSTQLRGTWPGANVATGPSVGTYDRTGFRLDCSGNNASASFYAHNGAANAYVDSEVNP